ncbi:apolipoprotein D [Condylostylus longicornis]|uniref:apolipoprotein D n=1 Tax=Condylostylus longicornis TaxID=2530218 RepID=UPI00244DDB7C|nr:apolipoprotein D [Condylostylus longicornis]XP_055374349.1 apolipoprotein D [Condylostylus longicornis]
MLKIKIMELILNKKEIFLTLFLLLINFNIINGYGFGRCPKYPSMPKFNMTKILGSWYEVERSFYLPEIASGCTTLTFQPEAEEFRYGDGYYRLEVAIKTINRLTGTPSVSLGYAKPENSKSSIMDFKFNTRFPEIIARFLPGSGRYQVLYTDYENFAILWSCSSFGPIGHADQIWILGRDRDFSAEIRKRIYDSLKKLGLDPDRLIISKNKNCPTTL